MNNTDAAFLSKERARMNWVDQVGYMASKVEKVLPPEHRKQSDNFTKLNFFENGDSIQKQTSILLHCSRKSN